MKKIISLIVCLVIFSELSVKADSWDDFSNLDRIWDGQKSITNQEFEQVMEKLEEKGKQKEQKVEKKKRKKLFGSGSTLHSELNPDITIPEMDSLKPKDEGILLNIPVDIIVDGCLCEKGYYKAVAEKDDKAKKIYVNLYQSQFLKAKIEVIETEEDYGKETLDFANIHPYNDSFVKFIFGSIDFNAYAYIPYVNK